MPRKRRLTYIDPDTVNTVCDITGFKVKLSDTVTRWDGAQVLASWSEERQPQDFQVVPKGISVMAKARGVEPVEENPEL